MDKDKTICYNKYVQLRRCKILNKKEQAFDKLKELYFNFDWSQENATINFVNEMGMIITLARLGNEKE